MTGGTRAVYRAIVITVSDRCASGERADESGPAVMEILEKAGFAVVRTDVVPDERADIERVLIQGASEVDLIVTSGGTGFSPRDVTPEATEAVCDRMAPGIPEAMRACSLKITPQAMLSRAAAGIRGSCLIVNLPGSPRAARENLTAVADALTHGIDMLRGGDHPKSAR
jgi:molybdenum cofactor synthesis domain-containing protein